jgi:hypothetical protein
LTCQLLSLRLVRPASAEVNIVRSTASPGLERRRNGACPALVTVQASPAAAHVYNTLSLQAIPQTATAPPVSQLQVCRLAERSWQLLTCQLLSLRLVRPASAA